jgi:hypothetical protein
MRLWPIAPLACAILLTATAARAEDINQRAARAKKECYSGNYQAGVELLVELFAETRDANYIFNQARCFEKNGKCSEALLSFREFMRIAKDLTPAERADVNRRIAACQGMKAEPQPTYVPPPPQPTDTTPAASVELPKPEATPASDGAGLRATGIVTMSIGAAAAIAGGVLGWQAKKIEEEVTNDNKLLTYDRKKDDRGKLFAKLQWVGYGVGGAAFIGGALMYYFGYRAKQASSAPIALMPLIAPDQAGALLQGRF